MNNGFGVAPLEMMAADAMLKGLVFLQEADYSVAWITGTSTALGALGTVPIELQIGADADFVIQEINFTEFKATHTVVPDPDKLLTLLSSGSGRQWVNQAQHVLNITGSYQANRVPGRLTNPILVSAKSSITCTLQDLSNVATERADLCFRGFKVYYITNPNTGAQGSRQEIFHAL